MEEWSNELILEFLSLYEKYLVIWDPSASNHKNRNVVADSWLAIKNAMSADFTIYVLKKKKESLMSTYRTLKRKVKTSQTSGAGSDDIYKPTWFAYYVMDNFLGKVGVANKTINTEDMEENSVDDYETQETREPSQDEEDNRYTERLEHRPTPTGQQCSSTGKGNAKRKAVNDVYIEKKNMKEACDALKVLVQRPVYTQKEPDECALYGQLLASKLRALSLRNRKILINKIDNLVFHAEMAEIDNRSTSSTSISFPTLSHQSPSDFSPLPSLPTICKPLLLCQIFMHTLITY